MQDRVEPEQHDGGERVEQLWRGDPEAGGEVHETAPIEQMQPSAGDVVSVEMAPHLYTRMPVEPVDVDLSVAVADVDEDRAVGHVPELLGSQHAIEPGGGHYDARLPQRVGERGDTAAVVLGLDRAHRVEIDDRDARAQVSRPQCDALAHRSEADHDDLAAIERQSGDRGERGPRLDADVMTVVDEVLERDAVPVQHGERDVDSVEAVQPGRGRLERAGWPMSCSGGRRDELAAHVAQRISRFAGDPCERIGMLGDGHPGPGADLDTDRGEVGGGPIIGAVRIARHHSYARAGLDQRGDDADGVGQDVLTARDRPAREIARRDLDAQRGRDRRRPRDPLQLCGVHGNQYTMAAAGRRPTPGCSNRARPVVSARRRIAVALLRRMYARATGAVRRSIIGATIHRYSNVMRVPPSGRGSSVYVP